MRTCLTAPNGCRVRLRAGAQSGRCAVRQVRSPVVSLFPSPRSTSLLATTRLFVHGGPGAPLRLFAAHAAVLVALLDVLLHSLLLIRVLRFVTAWHSDSPIVTHGGACNSYSETRTAPATRPPARHLHTHVCQHRRMRRWNGTRTSTPAAARAGRAPRDRRVVL